MSTQPPAEQLQENATLAVRAVKVGAGQAAARASTVLDEAKTAAGTAEGLIEDAARQAGSQAAAIGQQAYAKGRKVAGSAARRVEEQPFAALLVAGAIGGAVGYLLGRR
jgi:ElaB/YqjD/DUF883 family membrane-anchored ribosome-binding protein